MSNPVNYFVRQTDLAEVVVAKLALANRVEYAEDGSTAVTTTAATVPDLGVTAWGLIKATSATVVASLTSFDPVTLVSSTITPTLAAGEVIRGFFTAITLTSGAVVCNNIKPSESSPVPGFSAVSVTPALLDDKNRDFTFTVNVVAGGFPPDHTQLWKKIDSGAYALLTTISDDNGHFTYTDSNVSGATSVIKYKARYINAASQLGAYSAEITPLPDLPVVTLGTGTWTHSTLTAAFVVTCPAGSTALDFVEIWGYADAAAVVAAGALTLLSTHAATAGAGTFAFSKAYAGLDDSADTVPVHFQARYKSAAGVYGIRSAVLSITTTDA